VNEVLKSLLAVVPGLAAEHAGRIRRQIDTLGELGGSRHVGLPELLAGLRADSIELLAHLESHGKVVAETEGNRFRFRLSAVLPLAWRMGRGNSARERFLNRRAREISEGRIRRQRVELWQELAGYMRLQRALRNPIPGGSLVALLIGSGAIFALGMSLVFGGPGVLCLLGVVAFHELGHYAAMRLFGYQDTSVFFIPFLGAATAGRKQDATLAEEFIVLMAGPLPGIALGVALAASRPSMLDSEVGRLLIGMLLAINLLNLLPVMPLDGGKAVERIVLAGRPWASLIVSGTGIAAFVALALWAGDPILVLFSALFAWSLSVHFRGMRLLQQVEAAAPRAETEEQRAAVTFRVLAAGKPRSFGQKVGLARLVEAHWIRPKSSRIASTAWLTGYLVILGGALVGSVAAVAVARGRTEPPEVDFDTTRQRWLDSEDVHPFGCGETLLPSRLAEIEEASASCLRPPWRMEELAPESRTCRGSPPHEHPLRSHVSALTGEARRGDPGARTGRGRRAAGGGSPGCWRGRPRGRGASARHPADRSGDRCG
jgi:Zn-dependent protease